MITDVSSFDEAGAQLVRLDAHFQTDYRARRARLHHVLPSPRMRALKGMWRSVAAGEGRGSTSRPIWAQLVQQFRKILARKPRYPTTRASFLNSIAGCFSVVGRIPGSGPRLIRERPTTAPSAWDTSVFVPRSVLRAVLFSGRCPPHSLSRQACPRALNAVPAISGVRPIIGGSHSQRRSRTLGERSKCVQEAILAGFPRRAENRTRT